MKTDRIYITETPRDAMQGWDGIIPANQKLDYINLLLKIGFDTIDVGSFVSPKAVPQMADTGDIISSLDQKGSVSKIMVVIGNKRGAIIACSYKNIDLISFPYSTSPSFLNRNINSDPLKAWEELLEIRDLAGNSGKSIRVYLSMAFGNPYGDPWSEDQIMIEVDRLGKAGLTDIAFSDITGEGSAESIGRLCSRLVHDFGGFRLGLHLHSKPTDWESKVEAAWNAGIRYFESAMGGYGGCPMTGYELLGNLNTLYLIDWCELNNIETGLDSMQIEQARSHADIIFRSKY